MFEFNSCMNPYIISFLEHQKPMVTTFRYAHYCGILHHLDGFLVDTECNDCNVTESMVFKWIATIDGKNSTVASYVGAIRTFFGFLKGYGFNPFLPPYPKVEHDYIAYDFSDDEIERFLVIADSYPHSKAHKYPYCCQEFPMMLRLLYGCGLRLEEATNIKIKDIDFAKNTLSILKAKNQKQRLVPMDNSLADILSQYCVSMGLVSNQNAYIFPSTDFSKAIPSYVFRSCFNRMLKKAGINTLSRKKNERGPCLHCFRHTFAHRSFKKGISEGWSVDDQIPWLSIYLGHNSLTETERYLKFNSEMFSEEISPFEEFLIDVFPEVSFDD